MVLRNDSMESIQFSGCSSSYNYIVPGWNDIVKDTHEVARQVHIDWRSLVRPRQCHACDRMRLTRLGFKHILRQCQSNEDTLRADDMAKSLADKEVISLWKSLSKAYNKKTPTRP